MCVSVMCVRGWVGPDVCECGVCEEGGLVRMCVSVVCVSVVCVSVVGEREVVDPNVYVNIN